ncbi:unnamed protein product [Blepharisma stoltei]|uniref:Uncharacterized protein n=1 Tax=Blepharisma stoltei TaxID=1481888 RepID=A0AAU9IBC9_9CILI|nr:unnamed protein product [Blepharisma stoltei]
MFTYINRKVKQAAQFPYTSTQNMQKIADEVLEGLSEKPKVYFTRNLVFCYKDNSVNVLYEKHTDQIRVCRNLIKSEEDLRGSLEREVKWREDFRSGLHKSNDAEARSLISACKAEMRNIKDLDETTREEGAKLCSKLYAKVKISNKEGRRVDSWHFYTRSLIEDNWYSYSN